MPSGCDRYQFKQPSHKASPNLGLTRRYAQAGVKAISLPIESTKTMYFSRTTGTTKTFRFATISAGLLQFVVGAVVKG